MKKNDVITVVSTVGEFVGKLDTTGSNSITLNDPRMLVTSQQGMGFARGICMTGKENPDVMTIHNYVFITETNEDIVKAYREAVSGLVL